MATDERSRRPVISIVRAQVAGDRVASLLAAYRSAIAAGLPAGIRATYAVEGAAGEIAILTVWRSRVDLDAMRASGEEPLARRLLREAGGAPQAEFLDVLESANAAEAR